jgi:hypothetical protein
MQLLGRPRNLDTWRGGSYSLPAAASFSSQHLAAAIPRAPLTALTEPGWSAKPATYQSFRRMHFSDEDVNTMSEEAQKARQALQESMDLRDQGHSDE